MERGTCMVGKDAEKCCLHSDMRERRCWSGNVHKYATENPENLSSLGSCWGSQIWFTPRFYHEWAVWPWASHLTSLPPRPPLQNIDGVSFYLMVVLWVPNSSWHTYRNGSVDATQSSWPVHLRLWCCWTQTAPVAIQLGHLLAVSFQLNNLASVSLSFLIFSSYPPHPPDLLWEGYEMRHMKRFAQYLVSALVLRWCFPL